MQENGPIGIFDSGYGGLTVLKEIVQQLPTYDYLYFGDNARTPYGNRSFETVYQYTLQCVKWLFGQGCPLVILACNTASAKALRTIQQQDLPKIAPDRRVLGVIRPTAEIIGTYSSSGHIGVLGTRGTVNSGSYILEIEKFFPQVSVYQQACPMWVPLVENNEHEGEGADYFVKECIDQLMDQQAAIDTLLLACTHYPLLMDKIREYSPADMTILSQGKIVADSLSNYLDRHPEMEARLTRKGSVGFYTTDAAEDFENQGAIFYERPLQARQVHLAG